MSERRACAVIAADRKMIRYQSRRPLETELRERLRELANERRRFGYRRLFILLRKEGEPSGVNRIYRLYREEGLGVRKRKGRKRAIGVRAPLLVEARANARWSLDFVHDQMAHGRRFRILNIVDDVTHLPCRHSRYLDLGTPSGTGTDGSHRAERTSQHDRQ
jgi:transposase InsO family protein